MTDNDNTQDSAAMPPASAGSVRRRSSVDILVRLRAWRDSPHCRALGYGSFGTKAADDITEAADEIASLRLTDAEREAVGRAEFLCAQAGLEKSAATLRGLLERQGCCPEREHPSRKEVATPARSGETGDDSPDRE